MTKHIYPLLGLVVALTVGACTNVVPLDLDDEAQKALLEQRDKKKWQEEDEALAKNKADSAAVSEENKRLYEAYLEDLRAYKESDHMVMFGWFAYWNPTSPDPTFSLDALPDSVDFVSNWGAWNNLSQLHIDELQRMKKKGTKMTIGWIIENVGTGFGNKTAKDWPDDPYEAIDMYAQAICDTIAKYDYDGFDIDYEPQFASPWGGMHCGKGWGKDWKEEKPLISCDKYGNKELENYFFKRMREILPEDKMLNINGSIAWIDDEAMKYFDYFVPQSYNGTAGSWYQICIDKFRSTGTDPKKIIVTETFQTNKGNADNFVKRYAQFATKTVKSNIGGIGAFHINEDFLHGPEYKNVRAAIQEMNPAFQE